MAQLVTIGYNGGWPSARLFGWSAADWSRPATNKSISSERKRKVYCSAEKGNHEQVSCWPVAAKRVGLLKSFPKKVKTERKNVSSAHKLDGLGKLKEHACTSFWTCSSSPGHWSHTQEPSSCHAAASTFKVCARKRNLLILRITCLDRLRWRYLGTLIGIRSFLEKGMANQEW